jgi:hypothetical protein
MGAPLRTYRRRVVALLASGVVFSLSVLPGGTSPAFAKPDTDPTAPTTVVSAPEPEAKAPEPKAPEPKAPEPKAPEPKAEAPEPVTVPEIPSHKVQSPPVTAPEPPAVEPPPKTQAPASPPQLAAPKAPAPVVVPEPPVVPRAAAGTQEAPVEPPQPRNAAPSGAVSPPAPAKIAEPGPASPPPDTAFAPVTPSAPSTATKSPSADPPAGLVPPSTAISEAPAESVAPTKGERGSQRTSGDDPTAPSAPSKANRTVELSEPDTLQASRQDVELAKASKPIELNPIPAPRREVDDLWHAIKPINEDRDVRDADNSRRNSGLFPAADGRWDRKVRQWRPDWVEYDSYYRPVICNPYRHPVRIIYIYQGAPRIVFIRPLERIVLEAAEVAAYSFTALLLNPVGTATNVAVGTFFGGGFFPGLGLPLPPPPRPVLRYDNVPVMVRYSRAVYEPFRVRRIIDVGDDARYGERKVLLDGVTPAWGTWTQTGTGERQFEVHRTQQFPGLDDPQEAPLPGAYDLKLARDESSPGLTRKDIFLMAAAGAASTLSLVAVVISILLGRRRIQH